MIIHDILHDNLHDIIHASNSLAPAIGELAETTNTTTAPYFSEF